KEPTIMLELGRLDHARVTRSRGLVHPAHVLHQEDVFGGAVDRREVVLDDAGLHFLEARRIPEQVDARLLDERKLPLPEYVDLARFGGGQCRYVPALLKRNDTAGKHGLQVLLGDVERGGQVEAEIGDVRVQLRDDLGLLPGSCSELDDDTQIFEVYEAR